jgi:hypothetical protein
VELILALVVQVVLVVVELEVTLETQALLVK